MNSKNYDLGFSLGAGLSYIRFIPSTNNFKALVRLPAMAFQEYVADPNRDYERGEVITMPGDEVSKYLLTGDGRIQTTARIENDQVQPSLLKLFRNKEPAPWVREEFCELGFERTYQGHTYKVKVAVVDDATPPPNATDRWDQVV